MKFRNTRRDSLFGFEQLEPRNLLSANAPDASFNVADPFEGFREQEQTIRTHLSITPETAHLQQGESGLRLLDVEQGLNTTTTRFQQTQDGVPIHRAIITVVQGENGEFKNVYDHGYEILRPEFRIGPVLSQTSSIDIATANIDGQLSESSVEPVLFYSGSNGFLGWQVNSLVEATDDDSDYQTVVDAFTGQVISLEKTGDTYFDQFESEFAIHPRIVINDATGPAGAQAYAAPFESVVALAQGCSGTLIAPDVVISARHCGGAPGDTIWFGVDSNNPDYTATVATAQLPAGGGTLLDGGDVVILTLTQDVPTNIAEPMRLIEEGDALEGQVAATIGYGWNGVGSSGHNGTGDDLRWGGENIIDVYGAPAGSAGSNIFSTDFDDGTAANNTITGSDPTPLQLEATTAPGDSGGPLLVQTQDGEWVIAGVLSGGTNPNSLYGDISWWTGVAPFRTQIEAAGGIFLGGGAGTVDLDKSTYTVTDTVTVTVRDVNAIAPIEVTLVSDSGDTETVTLNDDGNFFFSATINTSDAAVSAEDGTLQVSLGDDIEVTYEDPDDGMGGSLTATDTANIGNIVEYQSGDVPVNILDNQKVSSTIDITSIDSLVDLNIQLDITHTWDADLIVDLVSPSGTTVNLFSGVGGDGDNFTGTILDDEADTSINNAGAPFTGTFSPAGLLSAFDGESLIGTWTLCITDTAGGDEGTLNSWSMFVDAQAATIGTVQLDSDSYAIGDSIGITVVDANATGPISVAVESASGDVETVTLTGSGVFTGSINVGDVPVNSEDGILQGVAGDSIVVTYIDDDTGNGNSDTVTDNANITNVSHFESDDIPVSIVDNTTVVSTLEVTNLGTVGDIDVQLNITHTWDSDLDVFLVGPDGTRVELFSDVGGSGDNFDDTILDDEAASSIAGGAAPFAGSFSPAGSLADFDGLSATGIWTLEITDDAGGDTGTLNSWCIYMDVVPNADPELSVISTGQVTENGDALFQVVLNQPATGTVAVDYETTVDGFAVAATPGNDFVAASGTLTFAPGETSKDIIISTNDDQLLEADEEFGLLITNSINADIDAELGSTVIEDDEVFDLGVPIDFGTETSPVSGVGVSNLPYADGAGMGWTSSTGLQFAERNRGTALIRDQAFFRNANFGVDIANGDYDVTVYFGVVNRVDPFQIGVEGGLNTVTLTQGPNVQQSFSVTVTDGRLDVEMVGAPGLDTTARISGLLIEAAGAGRSSANLGKSALVWTGGDRTDNTGNGFKNQDSPRFDLPVLSSLNLANQVSPLEVNDTRVLDNGRKLDVDSKQADLLNESLETELSLWF